MRNYLLVITQKFATKRLAEPEEIATSVSLRQMLHLILQEQILYRWWLDCNLKNIKDKNMFKVKKFLLLVKVQLD